MLVYGTWYVVRACMMDLMFVFARTTHTKPFKSHANSHKRCNIYIWISSFLGRRFAQNDLYHECAKLLHETKTLINTLFFQSTCIQRAIDSHQVVKMTNGANIRFSTENALNWFENQYYFTTLDSFTRKQQLWLVSCFSFYLLLLIFCSFSSFYTIFRSIVWILLQSIKCLQILTLVLLTFQIRPYNYWVYAMQLRLIRLWTP